MTIVRPASSVSAEGAAELDLDGLLERACARIAPSWPLDRFIAVNPLWGMIGRPVPEVSAELAALSGAQLVMPRAWFREQWQLGRFRAEQLREAIARAGSTATVAQLIATLETDEPARARRARVMDVVDQQRDLGREVAWRDHVIHNISQFCAAYFDDGEAALGPDRRGGLYASWHRHARADRTPGLLMGMRDFHVVARGLPGTARDAVRVALAELEIPPGERDAYATGLLLDLNGWAAWCAYLRWTARLAGRDDDHLAELLAIRCAWECLLFRAGGPGLAARWRGAMAAWPTIDAASRASQAHDWLLQHALELGWQRELCRQLSPSPDVAGPPAPPCAVQAVFCIDVRSEVFRRALEAESPRVRTVGAAGFFGVPIEYLPVGAASARPQLPGLIAPRLRATDDAAPPELAARRADRLAAAGGWQAWKTGALSCFAFVEAMGGGFAGALLGESFAPPARAAERAGLSHAEHAACQPRLTALAGGAGAVELEARCALAEAVLRAIGLARELAPLVVLIGHGSETRNNPHAAGLDCGACGGQPGEVNARVAAALLNEPAVRAGLAARGIVVPAATRFLAGLHNTTTDEVTLFELDHVPARHRRAVGELRAWLAGAGKRARRERSARLGLDGLDDARLLAAMIGRARDWAEVRPEWGLADNAAFIAARRERTRHLDLAGRAFLHDYRAADDPGFAILELIMTAPMVVAHWINFQYYASTVDNQRYGSGNKVLHNVVGGHLGVFEGNGGDLRIGLAIQALHDGGRWVHTPRRLSVFLEAPREAIDAVLRKHDHVRALVEHAWLYLFQLDPQDGAIRERRDQAWHPVVPRGA